MRSGISWTTVFIFFLSLFQARLSAQSVKLLRFDEDYSILRDSARTPYHRLKFIPLSRLKNSYLSLGGEVRQEFGGKIDEDWIKGQGYNYSLLQRYSIHAEINVYARLRFFMQLNSALENGSKYGPAPGDEDQLNVQNLFGEFKFLDGAIYQLGLRLGRQEINYGSGRLLSVRDGNTTRQYFNGAKLMFKTNDFVLDAFLFSADEVKFGLLDNRTRHQANLWGAYWNIKLQHENSLDLYYLGINRMHAKFEQGNQNELRHTLAARYFKNGESFSYNFEAAYQFGKFGQATISAWTTAIELGYSFKDVRFAPSFHLRNDYISGDKLPGDKKLQTFNPLYPKGGYFGFNPLVGPSNLIDIHPYLTLGLTHRLTVQGEVAFNWRYSLQDGLYRPSGNFNVPGSGSAHRYIGTTYLISADYQFNEYLQVSCGGQYFSVGDFIRDITPHWANSKYFNVQLALKF